MTSNQTAAAPIMPDSSVGLTQRIEALERTVERLEQSVNMDFLTGIPNRAAFDKELKSLIAEVRRGVTGSFGLILIDVDDFKKVNDDFGHPVGDEVLVAVADAISNVTREFDHASRYGGEEFAVLVRCRPDQDFDTQMDRLINAVDGCDSPVAVTISAGMSFYDPSLRPSELIANADEAMYHSKDLGKNRGTLYGVIKDD